MTSESDEYETFVEHPRFGRKPKFTGLDPSPADDGVHLHWNMTSPNELAAQWKAAAGQKCVILRVDFGHEVAG